MLLQSALVLSVFLLFVQSFALSQSLERTITLAHMVGVKEHRLEATSTDAEAGETSRSSNPTSRLYPTYTAPPCELFTKGAIPAQSPRRLELHREKTGRPPPRRKREKVEDILAGNLVPLSADG